MIACTQIRAKRAWFGLMGGGLILYTSRYYLKYQVMPCLFIKN